MDESFVSNQVRDVTTDESQPAAIDDNSVSNHARDITSEEPQPAVTPESGDEVERIKHEAPPNKPEEPEKQDSVLEITLPRRQLLGLWSSITAAVCFLTITAIYAAQYPLTSGVRFIYSSSSNPIFVLSLLSGLTGLLLGVVIDSTFELVQWLLMLRRKGLIFPTMLALHGGTGLLAQLELAFGRGIPLRSATRGWSIARLAATMLVPVLGVVIMSMHSSSPPRIFTDRHRQCEYSTGLRQESQFNDVSWLGHDDLQCITGEENITCNRSSDTGSDGHVSFRYISGSGHHSGSSPVDPMHLQSNIIYRGCLREDLLHGRCSIHAINAKCHLGHYGDRGHPRQRSARLCLELQRAAREYVI
jgi:uncharacterized integral membrane protein